MFDVLIFVIILYFMWKGYQRGFARELPRLGAIFAAMVIGIIFYSIIATVINSTPFPQWVGSFTSDEFKERIAISAQTEKEEQKAEEVLEEAEPESLEEEADENAEDEEETTNSDETEESAESITEEQGNKDLEKYVEKAVRTEKKEHTVNQIYGAINSVENKELMIGEFFTMYMSLILIFFVAYYILRKFSKKKKLYRKINVPVQLNPALGGCVGILKGLFIVYMICAFLVICEPLIQTDFIIEQINKSELAKALYDKNYIANIVARQDFLSGGI